MPDSQTRASLSGQDLAALRRKAGLSRTELAQVSDLTRYSVGRWEQKAVIDIKQDTP